MTSFIFACLYWGGVVINAARLRKRTGRTPSVEPRNNLDYLIWLAWLIIIVLWAGSPWFSDRSDWLFDSFVARVIGYVCAVLGFLGTWWCYFTLGSAWGISVDEKRTNELVRSGPYGVLRHPIYTLQWLIVLGAFLITPTIPLLVGLAILTVFMQIKGRIEEKKLGKIFGDAYSEYSREVGGFFPKLFRGS